MTTLITPRIHDIGGFNVRRAVPSLQARSVGPFVFVDHMGPGIFEPGRGIDVRPHPHIGLATVTYLWDGALRHRDSLGSVQDIVPGDVNWMTSGRGIVHSERTPPMPRAEGHRVHGMQTWVALPRHDEDIAPSFQHHPAANIPERDHAGVRLRVVAGRGFGMESPVRVHAETFNVALDLETDAELDIEAEAAERALYVLEGECQLDGTDLPAQHLLLLEPGQRHRLHAKTSLKAMLFGGEPLDGPRHLWWNFVASSRERIEQAKLDWDAGRFGLVPGDSDERIPLPER